MAFTDQEILAAQAAAASNAARGVKSLMIGDRSVTYMTVEEQIAAARAIQCDIDGGIYDTVPKKKNYF